MKRKKVLFLIHDLGHGGAERVLVNLVNNMDNTKFDITLQSIFDVGIHKKRISENVNYTYNFKHMIKGNSRIMKLFSPKILYKLLIHEKYDIVISYLEGTPARIISGCPSNTKKVCWLHVQLDSSKEVAQSFRSLNEAKKCYESFDQLIAVAETVKESFYKSTGIKKECIKVLYNTNDTDEIIRQSKEQIDDLLFKKKEINICSVGRIIEMKGYWRLAKVHKKLIDQGIKHNIYILGVGNQENKIRKYISDNHLNDTFIFLGFKDNPYKYVKNCDLFICSSFREGFSTAVTESLIVGTPVVSTLCSGAQELLGYNNEYGLVVENSEEGIYEGLYYLLTHDKELARYKELAQKRGKNFSKERTVKSVETMLEELI